MHVKGIHTHIHIHIHIYMCVCVYVKCAQIRPICISKRQWRPQLDIFFYFFDWTHTEDKRTQMLSADAFITHITYVYLLCNVLFLPTLRTCVCNNVILLPRTRTCVCNGEETKTDRHLLKFRC